MKDVAKYLPGIGWSFMFMEYPLLKRDWTKDRKRLETACKNLVNYPVNMLVSCRTAKCSDTAKYYSDSANWRKGGGTLEISFVTLRPLMIFVLLYSSSYASLRKARDSLKRSML